MYKLNGTYSPALACSQSIKRADVLRWLCVSFLLVGLLAQASPVKAQEGITVLANEYGHVFQEAIVTMPAARPFPVPAYIALETPLAICYTIQSDLCLKR